MTYRTPTLIVERYQTHSEDSDSYTVRQASTTFHAPKSVEGVVSAALKYGVDVVSGARKAAREAHPGLFN
jgi:hypothetical protein